MKNLIQFLVVAVALSLSSVAHAKIWQTANVLQSGAASIGGNGQLYFDPTEFMLNSQLLYGIGNKMQVEARVSLGSLDFYTGVFAKYHILTHKIAALAAWSGFHLQGNAFWDLAPIVSHDFGVFDLYFAPYVSISLGARPSGVTFNPGFSFDLKPGWKIYSELAIKISNIPTSLAAGVRYIF